MGSYGGFYKGEKRKLKKKVLLDKATKISRVPQVPRVEITGKKGQ